MSSNSYFATSSKDGKSDRKTVGGPGAGFSDQHEEPLLGTPNFHAVFILYHNITIGAIT